MIANDRMLDLFAMVVQGTPKADAGLIGDDESSMWDELEGDLAMARAHGWEIDVPHEMPKALPAQIQKVTE